jgi:hypothetical protein
VGFNATGFTRANGTHRRCDDQDAAGAQSFLYAESAANSKPWDVAKEAFDIEENHSYRIVRL